MDIASNYKLEDRLTFRGLQISIENKKGSTRSGVNPYTHKKWSTTMTYPYGYIRMSMGVDGDHVDCFIGPNENAPNVFVVHQIIPETGKFDEDKVMLGFDSAAIAKKAYLENYDTDEYFGSMDTLPFEKFKEKVLATKDSPKKIAAQSRLEATMALVTTPIKASRFVSEGTEPPPMGAFDSRKVDQNKWFPKKPGDVTSRPIWNDLSKGDRVIVDGLQSPAMVTSTNGQEVEVTYRDGSRVIRDFRSVRKVT